MHTRKRQPVDAKLNHFHLFCLGSARSWPKQFKALMHFVALSLCCVLCQVEGYLFGVLF